MLVRKLVELFNHVSADIVVWIKCDPGLENYLADPYLTSGNLCQHPVSLIQVAHHLDPHPEATRPSRRLDGGQYCGRRGAYDQTKN